MAQFDVYRISERQWALDCQSRLLDHLGTRFVIPLLRSIDVPEEIGALHPHFEVQGQTTVMATHLAGSVPAKRLREKVGSLADQSYAIQRAIDTLIGAG